MRYFCTVLWWASVVTSVYAQEDTPNLQDSLFYVIRSDSTTLLVEVPPETVGGITVFHEHLMRTLRYPEKARKKKIQGKIWVEFIVEKDGALSNIKVIEGIGGGCDEEAMRVIRTSPPWKAGNYKGHPVRVYMRMPISFKLG